MADYHVVLSNLAKQAPFVDLPPEQEQRVRELIDEIKTIFDRQVKRPDNNDET